MIVRLKVSIPLICPKIFECFNSMIVRLKVLSINSVATAKAKFQFYDSPIKRFYKR